ncbi:MAG: Ig-like domain-containing protein [Candidatus Cloacimonetes bacterium]|nr:Ig-like domain-containing protein [Candidatus Cloacimonadota bacterium]
MNTDKYRYIPKYRKKIKKLCVLCVLCVSIFLLSCGKEKPPTGGPKDTVPPEIINGEPSNLTNNYNKGKIEITFSEQIDPDSFQDALIIYPTILNKRFSESKSRITIKILEKLLPDQTYHITIDNQCQDIRNNHLEDIYHFVFSTGDSIDSNSISGNISIEEGFLTTSSKICISLYSIEDTILITKTTPRSDNTFDFTNLRNDTYLISAFEDINGDLEYDFKKELFDKQEVSLIYPVQSVDLKLTLQDTTKPELKKIISKSKQHLLVEFSEEIKQIHHIAIINKVNNSELEVLETMLNGNEMDVITAIPDTVSYILVANNIIDLKNNINLSDSINFVNTMPADTNALLLTSCSPEDGTTVNNLMPSFLIEFNKIIALDNLIVDLKNCENNNSIKFNIDRIIGNKFKIQPQTKLQNYVPYKLVISSDCKDYEGNKLDKEVTINILPIIFQ